MSGEAIRPSRPRRAREIRRWDDEADVLVVGLGIAGACAAMEAADAGAQVLAVERAGAGGGTSANSGGLIYLGGGTPVQQACGFDDTPDDLFDFLAAISEPGADRARIRLFADGSVEHFHWLEGKGVPFARSFCDEPGMESPDESCLVFSGGEDCHPWNRLARPAPRGHKPRTTGKAGPFLMQCLLGALARHPVRSLVDACVETLVQDDDGRVVGCVARCAGEERTLRARRGLVLAAGGFVSNEAMLALHAPALLRCNVRNGVAGDDGRGIRMGQGAGGAALRMDLGEVALPSTIPNRLSRGLYVNRHGQRFINEDTYYGHIGVEGLFRQEGRVYLLLDDATFERGLVGLAPRWVGDSIEEVERESGLPAGSLVSTVALYNRHAARGEDPLFHKRPERIQPLETPPFALVDCSTEEAIWATFTLGGLHTDAEARVLDPDGRVVPGLHAAGRNAALFCGHGYPGSGISLADGSFFGRRAGRRAARDTG
ncbi:MAG: FAD-dependent oxidoreductase [Myxococcota bacterium]